ncbi:MAG: apolipoprotein N-acyltransferase [Betaproteobacteria bacterium]|nr:apolipoprotein N-acyltransferase [Betaproteobacteria bacterium]
MPPWDGPAAAAEPPPRFAAPQGGSMPPWDGPAAAWRPGMLAVAVSAVAAVAGGGAALGRVNWTDAQPAAFTVSLLQGNVEQSLKWQPERLTQSLDAYLQLARRHPARLLVLPETALPTTLDGVPQGYLEALAEAAGPGADVLLGIVTRDNAGRYLNSAVGYGASPAQRYSKNHLVPFGEFTPPLLAWTLEWLRIPMSDFARGGAEQPPLRLAGEAVAPNICYEDVFGEEIIRALPQATLLVNLSNTAWFGDSLAQPQHLQISRMRALESGRMMLRATNTGMTAVIGARGELLHTLPPFTAGALTAEVRGYTGTTPYARLGNGPVVLAALAAVGWSLGMRRRLAAHGSDGGASGRRSDRS